MAVELTDEDLRQLFQDALQAFLDRYNYIDIYELDETFVDDMIKAYRESKREEKT